MSSAKNSSLFEAVKAAVERLSRTDPPVIPTLLIQPRAPMYRARPATRCAALLTAQPELTAELAAEVRTPTDENRDSNRWSGTGFGRVPSQAGLYVSLSTNALSAEVAHYRGVQAGRLRVEPRSGAFDVGHSFTRIAPNLRQVLFVLHNQVGLMVVDFSPENGHADAFFEALDANPEVAKALGNGSGGTFAAARSDGDYSCARAIGLALASLEKPSFDGIIVQTARDNRAVRDDGNNLVLFGPNDKPHPKLVTDYALIPTLDKDDRMTLERIYPR